MKLNIAKLFMLTVLFISQSLLALPIKQKLSLAEPYHGYIAVEYKDVTGTFLPAGRLSFKKYVQQKELTIPNSAKLKKLTLRLTPVGGHSYLDSLSVNGLYYKSAKLKKTDNDLITLENSTEYTFKKIKKSQTFSVSLAARTTSEIPGGVPVQFPLANTNTKINLKSDFYRYKLDSNIKKLTIDGELDKNIGKPFFVEYYPIASGHPQGTTYGWLHNDKKNMYVTIDFTSDNTMDGLDDNAKVFIKDGDTIKSYMITIADKKWGKVGFTYTDQVNYQHKVYEFTIPLSEFKDVKNGNLQLAFSAYGTSAAPEGLYTPSLCYNSVRDEYLLTYLDSFDDNPDTNLDQSFDGDIKGMILSPKGVRKGEIFSITNDNISLFGNNSVRSKSVYIPENDQYFVLIVSKNIIYNKVFGQFINADGSRVSDRVEIKSTNNSISSYDYQFDITYNENVQKIAVSWVGYVSGQGESVIQYSMVDLDGSVISMPAIASNGSGGVSIKYDKTINEFIAFYCDGEYIYSKILDNNGTSPQVELYHCSDSNLNVENISVVYNQDLQKYFVSWRNKIDNYTHSIHYLFTTADGSEKSSVLELKDGDQFEIIRTNYNSHLKKNIISYRNSQYSSIQANFLSGAEINNSFSVSSEFTIDGLEHVFDFTSIYNPSYKNIMYVVADYGTSTLDIYSHPETVFDVPEIEFPLDYPEGRNESALVTENKMLFKVIYYGEGAPTEKILEITEPKQAALNSVSAFFDDTGVYALLSFIFCFASISLFVQKKKKTVQLIFAGISVYVLILLLTTCSSSDSAGNKETAESTEPAGTTDTAENIKTYELIESDSDDTVYKDGKEYYFELEIPEKGQYSYKFRFKDGDGDVRESENFSFEIE